MAIALLLYSEVLAVSTPVAQRLMSHGTYFPFSISRRSARAPM